MFARVCVYISAVLIFTEEDSEISQSNVNKLNSGTFSGFWDSVYLPIAVSNSFPVIQGMMTTVSVALV